MRNEFTAIMEKDQDWYIAYCAEIPGANGQGKTKQDCLKNLGEAVGLILEDRRQDGLRGHVTVAADAGRERSNRLRSPMKTSKSSWRENRSGRSSWCRGS